MFNFVDSDEEVEEDEEFLDLSDLDIEEEAEDEDEDTVSTVLEAGGFSFEVEDDIPAAKSLVSEEIKARARAGRKRSPAKMDYYGKRAEGWSLFCSHKKHLPTLCERGMNNGEHTCTCPCHEERGYVRPQSESVSGSDDEDFVLILD